MATIDVLWIPKFGNFRIYLYGMRACKYMKNLNNHMIEFFSSILYIQNLAILLIHIYYRCYDFWMTMMTDNRNRLVFLK